MPFTFKLSQRLARMWRAPFIIALPALVPDSLNPHNLTLYALAIALLRVRIVLLMFPNRRRWCIPVGNPQRWIDRCLSREFHLPPICGRYPVVCVSIRGVQKVCRRR